MGPELLLALVLVGALWLYSLSGGADYGGGVWDLLASGPTADRQRRLIARTLAPIWEANHVWLILVVVVLFVGFPAAFSRISIVLHLPLTLVLFGIVLRGAAFVFRAYGPPDEYQRWSRVFAVASTLTPVALGVVLGAVASGRAVAIPDPQGWSVWVDPWLHPFPLVVGLFTLGVFAYLAAVYLTVESRDTPDLADAFRRRALVAGIVLGPLAFITLFMAPEALRTRLLEAPWSGVLHLATGGMALGTLWMLWQRAFQRARILAILQVSGIIWGWALAQFPYLVLPDLDLWQAAAPTSVLWPVLVALAAGALLLIPAFVYLYRVFTGRQQTD